MKIDTVHDYALILREVGFDGGSGPMGMQAEAAERELMDLARKRFAQQGVIQA